MNTRFLPEWVIAAGLVVVAISGVRADTLAALLKVQQVRQEHGLPPVCG